MSIEFNSDSTSLVYIGITGEDDEEMWLGACEKDFSIHLHTQNINFGGVLTVQT